jgi:hypothetical protein
VFQISISLTATTLIHPTLIQDNSSPPNLTQAYLTIPLLAISQYVICLKSLLPSLSLYLTRGYSYKYQPFNIIQPFSHCVTTSQHSTMASVTRLRLNIAILRSSSTILPWVSCCLPHPVTICLIAAPLTYPTFAFNAQQQDNDGMA